MEKLVKTSVPRFILKWAFIGWWAVPLLVLFILLCALFDFGGWWDGEKWNHNEDLWNIECWAFDKILPFFSRSNYE